jgi:hypothetical protein
MKAAGCKFQFDAATIRPPIRTADQPYRFGKWGKAAEKCLNHSRHIRWHNFRNEEHKYAGGDPFRANQSHE